MKILSKEDVEDMLYELRTIKDAISNMEAVLAEENITLGELFVIYKQYQTRFEKEGNIDLKQGINTKEEYDRLFEIMNYVDEFEGIPTLEDIENAKKQK